MSTGSWRGWAGATLATSKNECERSIPLTGASRRPLPASAFAPKAGFGRHERGEVETTSMRPRQAERHHLFERALHRRGRKQRQRVDGHRAVVLGAVDGILKGAVLAHQADRV